MRTSGDVKADCVEQAATYERPGRAHQLNRESVHVQYGLADLNPKWEEQAVKLAATE